MDRERFDALARLLATTGSRRAAVSALLSVAFLGQRPETLADRREGQASGARNARGHGDDRHRERARTGSEADLTQESAGGTNGAGDEPPSSEPGREGAPPTGRGLGRRQGTGDSRRQKAQRKKPKPRCFDGGPCTPAPRANLQRCDFANSNALENANCVQCNLQGASLRRADASGADFTKANLSRACLVEADLRGATIARSANLRGAILCRTTMPDGRIDNSGCDRGTPCCPTCIGIGDACGGSAGGACCGGAACQGGHCACPTDRPANCDGVCRQCCERSDCPARVCRTADCTAQGTCNYSVVPDNRSGPRCPSPLVCCDGGCCAAEQVCDTRGDGAVCCTPESPETTCNPPGRLPRCGRTPNNCGDLVDCGPCEEKVCNSGTCANRLHICQYTPIPDLSRCTTEALAEGICCDGTCAAGDCCSGANCKRNANRCANNSCRCGSGAACTFPNSTCCGASPSGTCVDTDSDIDNCGRCGNRCSRYRVCSGDPPRCCQPPGTTCSYLFGLQRNCCSSNCRPFPFAPIGIGTCH